MSPNFAKKLIEGKTEVDVSKVKQIIDMTEETLDFVNYSKKQGTVWEGMSDNCATFVFLFCVGIICVQKLNKATKIWCSILG